ncbi:MAG TPA: glycoside hydrolase family 3 N-terminal domain-containing protein [Thermoanaerobaculia bacterium]
MNWLLYQMSECVGKAAAFLYRYDMYVIAALLFAASVQIHPEIWPALKPPPRDAKIEKAIDELMRKMTLEEKVAQVIQPAISNVTPEDVRQYHFGSILNGGGGWPGDVHKVTAKDWLAKADAFYDASMDTSTGKQAIPVIWGADAVHGHNNVVGATLFPHNIGLGATRDAALVKRIGEITADEMAVTGLDWDFFPNVSVVRDDRWGRTYESYSEDPSVVRKLGASFITGLQSHHIIATAKHFLGDGGTNGGKDQGDNLSTEEQLRDIHAAGYAGALNAGVQTIMVSYNSWHGQKMHDNGALLTDVLKKRMGFDGFLVGDWNGHGQVPGCTNASCPQSFNAGLDMFMVPEDWKALYANTLAQVRSGEIRESRLDDAVRRILRVKMRAGLFTEGKPSQRPLAGKMNRFGSAAHRDVARRAVAESLVLLKNNGGVLPIAPKKNVLVAGDGADSIAKATGGWTLSWQGNDNNNADFPGATSIWQGVRQRVESNGGQATLSVDGSFTQKPDVAVVVYGEDPYAEFQGDRRTLIYSDPARLAMLQRFKDAGVPVVSVFLSGRPLWVNPFLNASDAFVAAWLPGTEGAGIADVLFGAHDFHGKLSFSWPKLPTQIVNRGDDPYDPLFAFGYGLTFKDHVNAPQLPVDTGDIDTSEGGAYFTRGADVAPWTMSATGGAAMEREGQESRLIRWTGAGMLSMSTAQPVDLTRESNANLALSIDLAVRTAPTGPVTLSIGAASLDITSLIRDLPIGEWRTIRVRLRCFPTDMSRINTFALAADGPFAASISDVKLVAATESPCPKGSS